MNIARRYLSKVVERCPVEVGCECNILNELPKDKPIDFEKNLNGTSVIPWKHLLILSHGFDNADNWPSKLELLPNSLANEMDLLKRKIISPYHPIMISNAIVPNVALGSKEKVYLYPDNKMIEFDIKDTKNFMQTYLVPPSEELSQFEPVYNPFQNTTATISREKKDVEFQEQDIGKDLILVCGHTQRDIRCGKMGPILIEQFKKTLLQRSLDVDVGVVSHIGGHAYAGNVIYFPQDTRKKSIWYGRVFPEKVAGIIDETVIGGNIIKELYRGEL